MSRDEPQERGAGALRMCSSACSQAWADLAPKDPSLHSQRTTRGLLLREGDPRTLRTDWPELLGTLFVSWRAIMRS